MILILSFAVGLAASLRPLADMAEWLAMIPPASRSDTSTWWGGFAWKRAPQYLVILGSVQVLYCFVIPLTPALIVARLRRPRPPLRGLACQPGFTASVALCVAAFVEVDLFAPGHVALPPLLMMILPGATVLASWSALVALRRWRPEPGWIDRAGVAVGAFWLATIPWSIWIAS